MSPIEKKRKNTSSGRWEHGRKQKGGKERATRGRRKRDQESRCVTRYVVWAKEGKKKQ